MMLTSATPRPAVAWDETACPLCGRRAAESVLEAPDAIARPGLWFAVVRCNHCQLHYTNPRPSSDCIGQFYPPGYKPHRRPQKIRHAGRQSFWSRWTGRDCPERRGQLPWTGPGRLLDFGCGGGSYLQRLAEKGWHVTGLDTAVGAAKEIRERLGLRALTGTLPHPELEPGSFDVITMWHSLEHVHDPQAILRAAFDLLQPGGKLIVACPNIESLPFRWFGSSWFALDLPRHLTHFAPGTLRDMLQACGYTVENVRLYRHSDWLRSSARLAVARGGALPWQRLLLAKPVARVLAGYAWLMGASDCMMAVARR